MSHQEREAFGSSWGVVLSTAGVAIGLGNIWRFPYMLGSYGGGGFLVVYLLVVFGFGVPALMCEWALGRTTRRGPMGAFERVGLPGGRWWGYLLLLTVVMASSYYSVVLGWVLYYSGSFAVAVGSSSPQNPQGLSEAYGIQFLSVMACILISCAALALGVRSGIERISKAITPLFFVLFMVLTIRILSLDGAWTTLVAYLSDVTGDFTPRTVLAAMGQGLFSLSLGGTFMVIYGSYLSRGSNIPVSAVVTGSLDAAAAILAALVVIPAVLIFGIPLDQGPTLIFDVMPQVFHELSWGNLMGAFFFLSVLFVALLSLMGAYEVMVGAAGDVWGWPRRKALGWIVASQSLLILPAIYSQGYVAWSDLVWGTTMQPFGAAISVIALLWCLGRTRALEEIAAESRLPVPVLLFYWMKYVVPLGIFVCLLYGWWG